MQNLRDRQIQAISKMLTLSSSYAQHGVQQLYHLIELISMLLTTFHIHALGGASLENFNDQWKVLIYDQDCRDIISPLMNVGSLRQKGVTLHMLVECMHEIVVLMIYTFF